MPRLIVIPVTILTWASLAMAQTPTFSLIPRVEATRQECTDGPNKYELCTAAADCEVGAECTRWCSRGGYPPPECAADSDCPSGYCYQRCRCDHVVQIEWVDVLTVDIWASNWAPGTGGWRAKIDFAPLRCSLVPLGWEAPPTRISCSSDGACPPSYPHCWNGRCVGEGHDPEAGAFIDDTRSDYIFFGLPESHFVETTTLEYTFGASVAGSEEVPADGRAYCGTVMLRILPGFNCGAWLSLVRPDTAFLSSAGQPVDAPIDIENLDIRGYCIDWTVVDAEPRCDASLTRVAGNAIHLHFFGEVPWDFVPEHVEIRELLDDGQYDQTMDLSPSFTYTSPYSKVLRIQENGSVLTNGKWYGILYKPAQFKMDYRVVYGDANDSGLTNFADLSWINANIGDPTTDWDPYDINASGFVNFADISAAFSYRDSAAPPKPTGHYCTIPRCPYP